MKVLVACECSGLVRDAFRVLGHDAWSCDLKSCKGDNQFHYEAPVELYLPCHWDLIIAFPPCTNLCVSGASHFATKKEDGRQQASIDFFMMFTRLDCRWAIENPVGIMSTLYREPNQIIHPWQYGHPEAKTACLWLNGLPPLKSTKILPLPECGYWENQTPSGQNKLTPSPEKAAIRSRTYPGIAKAMATQWSNLQSYARKGSLL